MFLSFIVVSGEIWGCILQRGRLLQHPWIWIWRRCSSGPLPSSNPLCKLVHYSKPIFITLLDWISVALNPQKQMMSPPPKKKNGGRTNSHRKMFCFRMASPKKPSTKTQPTHRASIRWSIHWSNFSATGVLAGRLVFRPLKRFFWRLCGYGEGEKVLALKGEKISLRRCFLMGNDFSLRHDVFVEKGLDESMILDS